MKTLSIVIPVFNEEKVIRREIDDLVNQLSEAVDFSYEIIMVENGSTDETIKVIKSFQKQYPQIRYLSLPLAAYGRALRAGVEKSEGEYIALFNIDFWDVNFLVSALNICRVDDYQVVVGSKTIQGARDFRPFLRRWITRLFNKFLQIIFAYRGTDSHGLKIFSREAILPIVAVCHTNKEIFDTELILKSGLRGLKILEIPVFCWEKRKSTYSVIKRIPSTIKDLFKLFAELYIIK